MTSQNIQKSSADLQEAIEMIRHDEMVLSLRKENFTNALNQDVISRYFEFIKKNPLHGFVEMNFMDYDYQFWNTHDFPQDYTLEDFALSIGDSTTRHLWYTYKHQHYALSENYFTLPMEYFNDPEGIEKAFLKLVNNTVTDTKNALERVFPTINNGNLDINIQKTIRPRILEEPDYMFIRLEDPQHSNPDEPFLYGGIIATNVINGEPVNTLLYNAGNDTILYNEKGYEFNFSQALDAATIL